jgi:hypothetical protein
MVPGGGRRSVVAVQCPARNALIKLARRARRSRCHDMPAHFSAICSSIIAYLDRLLQIQIASVS